MASPEVTAKMPSFIYGTAWKKERTATFVVQAVHAGFRGIDTAGQPKHYREDLVGQALNTLAKEQKLSRQQLFLQTKFTSLEGQDRSKPLPYEPSAELATQVRQSFSNSLKNLQTTYLDSILLHGPMATHEKTMVVWRVFEELYSSGQVKMIGISNCYDLSELERLFNDARIKPAVVQNRFYSQSAWDVELRAFCRAHNIVYQSFWTLTGNMQLLQHPLIAQLSSKRSITPAQLWFRFVMRLGIVPLTGTTNERHMQEDLAVSHVNLTLAELQAIADLIGEKIDALHDLS